MRKLPVIPDAFPYIAVLLLATLLLFPINPLLGALPVVLLLFTAYFFRNPPRRVPLDPEVIVSPADGVILDITEVNDCGFFQGEVVKISIFLSIFNVHINRCPIGGQVEYRHYRKGKFLPAFKSHASEYNERNHVGFANPQIKVMVTQITGFLARRIVCWVNPGDSVCQGEAFGLIKFGSCTEIVVPKGVQILVRKGQKVKGGETIIGRIKTEDRVGRIESGIKSEDRTEG